MRGARAIAVAGAIAAAVAMLLPWVRYGGVEVRFSDIPWWPLYLAAATAQQGCVLAVLLSGTGGRRVAALALGLASGAAAVAAAVTLMVIGQDPAAVFGPVVPPIRPVVSSGGLLAVAAVVISGAASLLATRAAPQPRPVRQPPVAR